MNTISRKSVNFERPLRLTGHPFIDVGVDTLRAIINIKLNENISREEITREHLKLAAERIFELYTEYPVVQRFVSIVFSNAGFLQPSFTKERKQDYARDWIFAFLEDRFAPDEDETCVFFSEYAANRRAYRQHIPLLNGEEISNFSAMGKHGLPVSGLAILAIHAMPLGCLPCSGRLLLFHQLGMPNKPESTELNYILAKTSYQALSIQLGLPDIDKLTAYSRFEKTQYVRQLLRRETENRDARNITGYHFTNYGPSPDIQILRLDNTILDFLEEVRLREPSAWGRVVVNSWNRGKDEGEGDEQERQYSNRLYEALFDAHIEPRRILPYLSKEAGGSWVLISLFLRKVMQMTEAEIQLYRVIGQNLAQYMIDHNQTKKGLSWSFYHKLKDAKYTALRKLLRLAQEDLSVDGVKEPLIRADQFIAAFERPHEPYHFYLARDLIVMVLVETLHDAGYTMGGDVPQDEDEFAEKYSSIQEEE